MHKQNTGQKRQLATIKDEGSKIFLTSALQMFCEERNTFSAFVQRMHLRIYKKTQQGTFKILGW